MNKTERTPLPKSWAILQQVLEDEGFDGDALEVFGEYTVSWNKKAGTVAVADAGGWWTMSAQRLVEIAAATQHVGHWNRQLWAVEMRSPLSRRERMIIGVAWHAVTWHAVALPAYEGEPSRCLLFQTRRQARAWCVAATLQYAKHSKGWRFRPVRVRETVMPHS
jgi:hypothetical protein